MIGNEGGFRGISHHLALSGAAQRLHVQYPHTSGCRIAFATIRARFPPAGGIGAVGVGIIGLRPA